MKITYILEQNAQSMQRHFWFVMYIFSNALKIMLAVKWMNAYGMAYFLIWSFPWHQGIIVIHKKYIDGVSPNQALDSIRTNQVFISPWYTKSFSLAIKSGVYRNNIIWFAWNWTFSSLTPTDTLTLKLYENPGSAIGVSLFNDPSLGSQET